MANPEHVQRLRAEVAAWNAWRNENRPPLGTERVYEMTRRTEFMPVLTSPHAIDLSDADVRDIPLAEVDLSFANLCRTIFMEANLRKANLSWANMHGADLYGADLSGANMHEAALHRADLGEANLSKADLTHADLDGARLNGANLGQADLSGSILMHATLFGANLTGARLWGANLEQCSLVSTNLTGADLTRCRVHGISVWDVSLDGTIQKDLIITRDGEPEITTDSLELAQFLYLLLNNQNLRNVLDTITAKVVLILGRFAPERKAVLDAIREELRRSHNYIPIVFDFEKPASRSYNETITVLARMARFVIADLTDATEVRSELISIVPLVPSVPIQPIAQECAAVYSTFEEDLLSRYPWVLPVHRYSDTTSLLGALAPQIIGPAERMAEERRREKTT